MMRASAQRLPVAMAAPTATENAVPMPATSSAPAASAAPVTATATIDRRMRGSRAPSVGELGWGVVIAFGWLAGPVGLVALV